MSLFAKKSIARKLIRQFGEVACGPNVHLIDGMIDRMSRLTAGELSRIPVTGDDLELMYPDCEAGANAAVDAGLISGRMDVIATAQDVIGAEAERRSERLRVVPRDKTCGPAIAAVYAVTALIVRDLVGSTFTESDRQRVAVPPYFIPKAESFTTEHYNAAVEPWVKAFGTELLM